MAGLWLSHHLGNVIIPTDELNFFRGVGILPTSIVSSTTWDTEYLTDPTDLTNKLELIGDKITVSQWGNNWAVIPFTSSLSPPSTTRFSPAVLFTSHALGLAKGLHAGRHGPQPLRDAMGTCGTCPSARPLGIFCVTKNWGKFWKMVV